MISSDPLSEAEFERLDAFLMNDEAPSGSMDSSMLDGYLTAVVSGPNLIMPGEMLRWVWDTETGAESPEFRSNKEAEHITRGEMPGIKRRQEPIRNTARVGRNDPCPCGSGKKFKHCHGGPWLH